MDLKNDAQAKQTGYAPINGLQMYYEVSGAGKPLVYIPPVFGFAGLTEFPGLCAHWQVIQVDLQGHGRTADIDRPISFAQHADDVAALIRYLKLGRVHLFGESMGGIVAMTMAIHYPDLVDRVATLSSPFGPFQDAFRPEMLTSSLAGSPDARGIQFQRANYKSVAPEPDYWPKIWAKVAAISWDGFTRAQIEAVANRVLIALGDHDFIRLEHALYALSAIPKAELAVIPDAGHFVLNEDQDKVIPIVRTFLAAPETRPAFATTATGYHPGETR